MIDENLGAEEAREWNWQALAGQLGTRYGLKYNDRQLKQIGKDELSEKLQTEALTAVSAIDLAEGQPFLEENFGLRSLCDWARLKFGIVVTVEELAGKGEDDVEEMLAERVQRLYRDKEIAFPVTAAMARYMSERAGGGAGQRYDREGLYRWGRSRFPAAADRLKEDDFLTQSRAKLHELLNEVSKSVYPAKDETVIDARLDEAFEGSQRAADAEDAKELADWARNELNLEVSDTELTGKTREQARDVLWNAFDRRYRPEMHSMERSLLLGYLDGAWKNHLYQMDHLRGGIGLFGYAQEDPKIRYKQEGMKEFKAMWEGIDAKVTESVFRMEEEEAFQEALWTVGVAKHEAAPRQTAAEQQLITNAGGEGKKPEPIRNRGERVGRNDPCPCGSGKKYKNCHMRQKV
jgi:preprotein translocase subunit SecA